MMLATRIAQEFNNVRDHLSLPAAYHLLGGNLSVDATVLTTGFGLYLYTGNGGTQSINLGMDLTTQWGDSPNETYGYLIKIKSRSAVGDWTWVNSVRGSTKYISSNTIAVEGTDANMFTLNTVAGVTTLNIGTSTRTNTNGVTYAVEVYQTTHRKTGVTNHGKAYTEHYNPYTGFTIIKYEGSGLAGHEIPHSLNRKLGFVTVKNLTSAIGWQAQYREGYTLTLNATNAEVSTTTGILSINDNLCSIGTDSTVNTANDYIMYGWANSYYDVDNTLIGNYEIGVYQGTGGAGNKVTTRGKPAWVMIKRLDVIADWYVFDNVRDNVNPNNNYLVPNASLAEQIGATFGINIVADSFNCNDTNAVMNALGGQYLYMVVYDNDSGSGKSKYYKATDTANVQISNGIIPLAHGVDSNGSKNSIVVANETITGLTYTEGKNYLYRHDTGYGVKAYEPRYLASKLVRRFAGEQPDYYDVESNKWFNCDAGTSLYSNDGTGITGWTTSGATATTANGTLVITQSVAAVGYITRAINTAIGTKYRLPFNFVLGTCASVLLKVGTTANGNEITSLTMTASTITYLEFVAQSTTTYITLYNNSTTTGQTSYWDNIDFFPSIITPTTEITESRNYMNHIVHADADGGVLYVEELPKIEYKNVIKADKLSAISGFDLGQTTNIYTNSKFLNIPYLNNTGKPKNILFSVSSTGNTGITVSIDNKNYTLGAINTGGLYGSYFFTVPPNSVYKILSSAFTIYSWNEYE